MGKNSKSQRDTHYEVLAQYQRLASEALTALRPRLAELDPPIVDSLPIADFSGRPESMYVWYAFRNQDDQRRAEASGLGSQLRRLTEDEFRRVGYPPSALPSIRLFFANRVDIDAAGGNFASYVR
jgi:hypothetical protein